MKSELLLEPIAWILEIFKKTEQAKLLKKYQTITSEKKNFRKQKVKG